MDRDFQRLLADVARAELALAWTMARAANSYLGILAGCGRHLADSVGRSGERGGTNDLIDQYLMCVRELAGATRDSTFMFFDALERLRPEAAPAAKPAETPAHPHPRRRHGPAAKHFLQY